MQHNFMCQDLCEVMFNVPGSCKGECVCVFVCIFLLFFLLGMLIVRKSRQTFLRLMFLSFALVIEAHCTLVDTICLHTISSPKPSGVVYMAKQGGGEGERSG